jgi:hypothetical protein
MGDEPVPMSIVEATKYSTDCHQFIWSQLSCADFAHSPRITLAFAYAGITLEHQYAILTLTRKNIRGSALALLRPQVETAFRGLWIINCGTDDEVEAICQRNAEPFPRFRDMAKVLDKAYGCEEYPYFQGMAQKWGYLNSLTHSGLEQLGRRTMDDGNMGPNYPDEQIADLLQTSATVSIALLPAVYESAGHNDKSTDLQNWAMQH